LIYTDPDGHFFWLIPIAAAIIYEWCQPSAVNAPDVNTVLEDAATSTDAVLNATMGAASGMAIGEAKTIGQVAVKTGEEILDNVTGGISSLGKGTIKNAVKEADNTTKAIKSAEDRAKEIHSVLDPRAQRARTTAVAETTEGTRVVGSSTRRLTPAQRATLQANEIEGIGTGHAEVTAINAARQQGLTPTGVAASRPICPNCAEALDIQGVSTLSPLK
jgi:hypothetical protein